MTESSFFSSRLSKILTPSSSPWFSNQSKAITPPYTPTSPYSERSGRVRSLPSDPDTSTERSGGLSSFFTRTGQKFRAPFRSIKLSSIFSRKGAESNTSTQSIATDINTRSTGLSPSDVVTLSRKWGDVRSTTSHDAKSTESVQAEIATQRDINSGKLTFTPFVSTLESSSLSIDDQRELVSRGWKSSSSVLWTLHVVPTTTREPYSIAFPNDSDRHQAHVRHAGRLRERLLNNVTSHLGQCSDSYTDVQFARSLASTVNNAAGRLTTKPSTIFGSGEIAKTQFGYYSTRKERTDNPPVSFSDRQQRGRLLRLGF